MSTLFKQITRDGNLENISGFGGYKRIYEELIQQLRQGDIPTLAEHLELALNQEGEAEVPFLGVTYLLSRAGVRRDDGQGFSDVTGSALIRYLLTGSCSRPAGEFVTFAMLAGPLFRQGEYSSSAIERPIIKRFERRAPELLRVATSVGGRMGGIGGLDSVSILFDLLPHILLQLIFYDKDDEFPARATLLFEKNSTQVLDFETLAVLVTIFVNFLTKSDPVSMIGKRASSGSP
ncbi:MAG: DUF3786 domain-containing protein [Deltaproteobacteria bacterium]|nr:DUF3786 domain-containing protein [Deltaproteobacteria bacterium]